MTQHAGRHREPIAAALRPTDMTTSTAHQTFRGTRGHRGRRAAPGIVALVAGLALPLLAACGEADPSGTTPGTTQTPTRTTQPGQTMTPPHDFPAAERVTVLRSGGLKPAPRSLVFALDRPAPDGFTRADVAAVLRAAADPALKGPMPTPRDICCDQFVYRVSIAYPDGTSTTFTTVDGAPTSPAVKHLVSLAS